MKRRTMRQGQTVSPFGVGAIVDIAGESFVAADIGLWNTRLARPISLARLAKRLGKTGFYGAPTLASRYEDPKGGAIFTRFPAVLFCPSCRSVKFWRTSEEVADSPAQCLCQKRSTLVPMRFVAVCEKGHMADVPWKEWAHSLAKDENQKQCTSPNLALLSTKRQTAGLDGLILKCRTCDASRSLAGISTGGSLKPLEAKAPQAVTCRGTQPWERSAQDKSCGELLQVVQRGATNVYFSALESAIDIPPGSDFDPYSDCAADVRSHDMYRALCRLRRIDDAEIIAEEVGCDVSYVFRVVDEDLGTGSTEPDDEDDLRGGEWLALVGPDREHDPRDRFIKRRVKFTDPDRDATDAERVLADLVDRVVVVDRLREVRVLRGFSRLHPNGPVVPVDLGKTKDWLPAIEVFGEGIFVSLDQDALREWERSQQSVGKELEARRLAALIGSRLPTATPRFVLLHTLAHLLIRQLVFECGYSAASLRERIYGATSDDGESQAGFLIYTAAGDSEGTMGGLARQAEPDRFSRSLLAALERGQWCSTDPLCRETHAQGFGSLNMAACHACALLPETSCEWGNKLLHRSLVVGDPGGKFGEVGFFEGVLSAIGGYSR